jgi:hypothetical protein
MGHAKLDDITCDTLSLPFRQRSLIGIRANPVGLFRHSLSFGRAQGASWLADDNRATAMLCYLALLEEKACDAG